VDEELETDYLVVGAGAAGMAFTDALLAHSDATVTIVDRRDAPGGHRIDAYPYVRLHQPSAFYGVSSVPLGHDARDAVETNAGYSIEGTVSATSAPPFEVANGVRCVPAGDIARIRERPERFVIIGAGKTALDACVWLLEQGVAARKHRIGGTSSFVRKGRQKR
jgi:cation diffusion facilitator CzcD-associated flavoprotein CzcO